MQGACHCIFECNGIKTLISLIFNNFEPTQLEVEGGEWIVSFHYIDRFLCVKRISASIRSNSIPLLPSICNWAHIEFGNNPKALIHFPHLFGMHPMWVSIHITAARTQNYPQSSSIRTFVVSSNFLFRSIAFLAVVHYSR